MSRCIVHVGMYKTGTTSIQRSLHGHADERFVYSDFGGHPNQSRALFRLLGFEHSEAPLLDQSGRAEALARFRKSMSAARGRDWIVSGEGIVAIPPERLKQLRNWLSESFDGTVIMAAIRAPASLMASAFQTRAKRVTRDKHNPLFRYRSYREMFQKFDDIFGRSNVHLWKFDPATYPGGCAVRDFCGRIGLQISEGRIVRVNESLSREALGLLCTYREFGRALGSTSMTGPQNARLAEALMPIGRTRFRYSPDAVGPVLEKHREDIAWMEARLGQSLHEELGPALPGDVRSEADLLVPDPGAVGELRALLGAAAGRERGDTPESVARLVHALREKGERVSLGARLGKLAGRLFGRAKLAAG